MYFTFSYNTFQNHDLMQPCKAIQQPWDKAGTDVYTRFGLTFRSVSVRVPIFRKYPLSRWWIRLVSDPSPKLRCVPLWMDELNPRLRSFHQVTRISHGNASAARDGACCDCDASPCCMSELCLFCLSSRVMCPGCSRAHQWSLEDKM